MEAIIIWLNLHPWAVGAACDVITVACCTIIVLLLARPWRQAAILPVAKMVRGSEVKTAAPANEPERLKIQTKVTTDEPFVSPSKRRLVNDALEAMGRWEATYRAGRGLEDLAKFARNSRLASKEANAEPR